jgi:hypothetical protein
VLRAPILIAIAVGLTTVSARAEEQDYELIAKGIQLRREHKDAEALEQFRRAYDLRATPKTLAQIALAEQALGDWVPAERDLTEVLSHDDPWIAERAEALKESLTEIRAHLASLQIETNAAGAELWQKGQLVGKVSGEPMRVASGELEIDIRAAGFQSAHRSVSVPAQSLVKLVVDLAPVAAPSPPPPPKVEVVAPPSASMQTTFGWVTLAAAGGSLATGIVGHIVHDVNATRYNDATCFDALHATSLQCGNYRDRADVFETVAVAGYVGAGVLGGASALLFVLSPKKSIPIAKVDFAIAASSAAVTWHGCF